MGYDPKSLLFSNRPSLGKPLNNAVPLPMSPLGRPSPLGKPAPWTSSQIPNFQPQTLEEASLLAPKEEIIPEEDSFEEKDFYSRNPRGALRLGEDLKEYIPGMDDPVDFTGIETQGQGFGQQWSPASRGTVSNPGGQGKEAYDNYRRNSGWIDDVGLAKENMEIAKANAYEKAYKSGDINPGSGGYARAISDQKGNIIGYIDKQGNQVPYDKSMGRMGAQSLEERTSAANRSITGNMLNRLGELAKKHESSIGPYAAKYVGLQRSGYIPGLADSLDPEVAEMYTISADLQNKQVYEQSGKQINEQEFKRLQAVMPRLDQDPVSFWAAYNNFLEQLKQRGITLAGQDPTSLQQQIPGSPQAIAQNTQAQTQGTRPGAPNLEELRKKYNY